MTTLKLTCLLAVMVLFVGCTENLVGEADEPVAPGVEATMEKGDRVGTKLLIADLNGANEVGEGDPDGRGTMRVRLNKAKGEICFGLKVRDIDTLTRAHIHRGVAGVNGPVEVFFFDTVIDNPIPVPSNLRGCVDASKDIIKEIGTYPGNFYINIHTENFPAGAVRGQLEKAY